MTRYHAEALKEWEAHPEKFFTVEDEEDGIILPPKEAFESAYKLIALRKEQVSQMRMGTINGDITFESRSGNEAVMIDIHPNGFVEEMKFINCKMVYRQEIELNCEMGY